MIGAIHGVPIIVGKIGEYLEKNGGRTAQEKNQAIEFILSCREKTTHANARKREGQRAQAKCFKPDFHRRYQLIR